jgi:hypothetical protein
MKTIQPVNVWQNGIIKSATKFDLNIVYDNLESSASFFYQLLEVLVDAEGNESTNQVAQGNLTMDGQEYQNWDDSNDSAYIWGADQLSLTII